MKNTLADLNNALFAQLERLSDETISAEQLAQELQRTSSVVQVADRIVDTARLQLDGARFLADHGGKAKQLPATLGLPSGAPNP